MELIAGDEDAEPQQRQQNNGKAPTPEQNPSIVKSKPKRKRGPKKPAEPKVTVTATPATFRFSTNALHLTSDAARKWKGRQLVDTNVEEWDERNIACKVSIKLREGRGEKRVSQHAFEASKSLRCRRVL